MIAKRCSSHELWRIYKKCRASTIDRTFKTST
ncbi:hypothetical protein F383_21068 [Gossypium arboreum]|uniref:Uncharacterized protein n=1 Tax=Gossypium arboreum TaxID=29729 RepID=A0A0B0NPA9_GOSAR|nr:hypothetical protein F383_21068 [Gossypium arboreum]